MVSIQKVGNREVVAGPFPTKKNAEKHLREEHYRKIPNSAKNNLWKYKFGGEYAPLLEVIKQK